MTERKPRIGILGIMQDLEGNWKMNGWLAAGGPHHEVMNLGHHAASWQLFCQLAA
jgi:L-arabinose isomerase C-terminal domain